MRILLFFPAEKRLGSLLAILFEWLRFQINYYICLFQLPVTRLWWSIHFLKILFSKLIWVKRACAINDFEIFLFTVLKHQTHISPKPHFKVRSLFKNGTPNRKRLSGLKA